MLKYGDFIREVSRNLKFREISTGRRSQTCSDLCTCPDVHISLSLTFRFAFIIVINWFIPWCSVSQRYIVRVTAGKYLSIGISIFSTLQVGTALIGKYLFYKSSDGFKF